VVTYKLQVSFVTNFVQISALGPTKLSVLLFYRRIFGVERRRFSMISASLIVLVIVWTGAFFFTNIFSYTPVSDIWTKPPGEANPTYDHVTEMYNAQCFSDMALDTIIVTLPLPQSTPLHCLKEYAEFRRLISDQFGNFK
jgi:hypothetical protein